MVRFLDDIREHAERRPTAVALRTPDGPVSYGRFVERVERLARALAARGVGPERVCAIALDPGADSVVAVAAVLRAGGAFLTLDLTQPAQRLAAAVESGGAEMLLTRGAVARRGALPAPGPVLDLDDLTAEAEREPVPEAAGGPAAAWWPEVPGAALAYVSHTSGSTGTPNAVLIERAGLDSYLRFVARDYAMGDWSVALQVAPAGYDASIRDTFAPLVAGGTLVLTDRASLLRADDFLSTVERNGVNTLLSVTPSFLTFLSQQDDAAERLRGLRLVVCSGESLLPFLTSGARKLLPGVLVNQYGPTECTMTATRHRVAEEPEVGADVVGAAIDGMSARLASPDGVTVAAGQVGEIVLGGVGVARGYRGNPVLTADRFRPDPLGPPGSREYRTGDLGRLRPDGTLEYLGRSDRQIKIRGYRVDPSEVEGALLTHPRITGAVVTADADDRGRVFLSAHLTGASPQEVTDAELRRHLAETLPAHMMPRRFHRIGRVPTTTTGKADRSALRAAASGAGT
ncbi:amino acid adenylation domain-containing protein [Streptomyces lonarensis]|uniref:amino acid adenylation domain-containing protein n=1 Tax=Streptomyces lonarensis TaxID=700599 RepID=UPI0030C691F3